MLVGEQGRTWGLLLAGDPSMQYQCPPSAGGREAETRDGKEGVFLSLTKSWVLVLQYKR